MKLSVFGLGYVGAVTMACLAKLGHKLIGIDVDTDKVNAINGGQAPVSEPGLNELLREGRIAGRIKATQSVSEAIDGSDAAIVCVGTPSNDSGGIEDGFLVNVVQQIASEIDSERRSNKFTIIIRSTCLPHVHEKLQEIIKSYGCDEDIQIDYVCHPEFLREGSAIDDFYEPPKIVFGISNEDTRKVCDLLYPGIEAPKFFLPVGVASMVKYADNCFHALKVTFANEIGLLCDAVNVDAKQVMEVFVSDTKLNISPYYLRPGAPFGGSCLPKDLKAALDLGRVTATKTPMLSGVEKSNVYQIERIAKLVVGLHPGTVGINGIAFKDNTDDLRESPAVNIAERLIGKGLNVRIFDNHLSVDSLTGANKCYALARLPHISSLILTTLYETVEKSDVVLNFHRIEPESWAKFVRQGASSKFIDFTGTLIGARGIFW